MSVSRFIYERVNARQSMRSLIIGLPSATDFPGVLGLVDDIWYTWNGDIGITGPDKGKGGI
jgi:hypothetical protein